VPPGSVIFNSMDRVRHAVRELRELPLPLRLAAFGGAVFGVLGGIVGLVLGLRTYVPTAWAAVPEVGIPAAMVGAALGLVVGSFLRIRPHSRHH
jgi:hypothetical protein